MIITETLQLKPSPEKVGPPGKAYSTRGLKDHYAELDANRWGSRWGNVVITLGSAGEPKNPDTPDIGFDADWRERGVIEFLIDNGISVINPKVLGWDKADAEGEVEGCENSTVILVCLDPDTKSKSAESFNTGLASLAELNAMLALSIFGGAKMVVAFRPEYWEKITDPVVREYVDTTVDNIRYFQQLFPNVVTLIESDNQDFSHARNAVVKAMEQQKNPQDRLKELDLSNQPNINQVRLEKLHGRAKAVLKKSIISDAKPDLAEYAQLGKKLFKALVAGPSQEQAEVLLVLDQPFNPDLYLRAEFANRETQQELRDQLTQVVADYTNKKRALPLSESEEQELEEFQAECAKEIADNGMDANQYQGAIDTWHEARLKRVIDREQASALDIINQLTDGTAKPLFKPIKNHLMLKFCPTALHVINIARARFIGYEQYQALKQHVINAKLKQANDVAVVTSNKDEFDAMIKVFGSAKSIEHRNRFMNRYRGFLRRMDELAQQGNDFGEKFADILKKALIASDSGAPIESRLERFVEPHISKLNDQLGILLDKVGPYLSIDQKQQSMLQQDIAPALGVFTVLRDIDAPLQPEVASQEFLVSSYEQHGAQLGLDSNAVAFCQEVVQGQNIFYQTEQKNRIESGNAAQAAAALLHLADTFTGVFTFSASVDQKTQLDCNAKALEDRFGQQVADYTNPVRGTFFRPEWVLEAVHEAQTFANFLEKKGFFVDSKMMAQVLAAAIHEIDQLYERFELDELSFDRVRKVRHSLLEQQQLVNPSFVYDPKVVDKAERVAFITSSRLRRLRAKDVLIPPLNGRKLTDEAMMLQLRNLELHKEYK